MPQEIHALANTQTKEQEEKVIQKTKIEWVRTPDGSQGYTWNPVTGCRHGCSYCYARKIATRFKGSKAWPNGFEPTVHPERFADVEQRKVGECVFVCSMADLFGDWITGHVIDDVLSLVRESPATFIFLTKNPQRLPEFNPWPKNAWVGMSVDTVQRAHGPGADALGIVDAPVRFLSLEPLLTRIPGTVPDWVNWIIIGAQTQPTRLPEKQWVEDIEQAADEAGVPVFEKNSLAPLFDRPLRQEFPKEKE